MYENLHCITKNKLLVAVNKCRYRNVIFIRKFVHIYVRSYLYEKLQFITFEHMVNLIMPNHEYFVSSRL